MSKLRRRAAAVGVSLTLFCFAATLSAQESEGDEAQEQVEEEQAAVPKGPTPKLFILPTDSLDGQVSKLVTDRINESKRGLLGSDRNLELLPTFREIVSQRAGSAYANVAQAEKIYTSAIGLLNVGNYQRAAELFQQALDIMEANLSGIQNYGVFSDTLSNLAAAYFHSGFDLDARQNIQKFAHLKPAATLDPKVFPQELRQVYQSEAERVQSAGEGILTIESDREGVMIFIDGELKGQAPLTVEDVGFGYHYLVARTSDAVFEQEIRVRGRGQEQTLEVNFAELEDGGGADQVPSYYVDLQETLRTGVFGADLEPYLVEVANQTQADFIAWVLLVRERSEYFATPFVYRSRDGVMIQGERTSFNLELSNLRSRINRLTGIISLAVTDMPEDLMVTEVDLTKQPEPEPEPVVVAEPEPDPSVVDGEHEAPAVAAAEEPAPREPLPVPGRTASAEPFADPSPVDEAARSKRLRYLGWGGATLLAGGAIAGVVIFLARGAGASEPPSFEAEVEW